MDAASLVGNLRSTGRCGRLLGRWLVAAQPPVAEDQPSTPAERPQRPSATISEPAEI